MGGTLPWFRTMFDIGVQVLHHRDLRDGGSRFAGCATTCGLLREGQRRNGLAACEGCGRKDTLCPFVLEAVSTRSNLASFHCSKLPLGTPEGYVILSPVTTLDEIEAAVDKLPLQQQKRLLFHLTVRLHDERMIRLPFSVRSGCDVLEIAHFSVKKVLRPLSPDDDLLDEMLEGRA